MLKSHRSKKNNIGKLLFFLFFLTLLLVSPSSAGFRVSGSLWIENVTPGELAVHEMTVSVPQDDAATDILIEVKGFGLTENFIYEALDPPDDLSPYSARQLITLDKSQIHLEPGSSEVVKATAKIPSSIGSGGRYAIILLRGAPTGTGTTGFSINIQVPVALSIQKPGSLIQGQIRNVQISEAVAGEPFIVSTLFTNTGNILISGARNVVTIKNSTGETVATLAKEITESSIIPTYTVRLDVPIDQTLPVGNYTVLSTVIQREKVLDEETATFTIVKAYIPPFQEITGYITPQNSAILASPNGRLSINFPQGAVLDNVKVTVKPVLPKTLPAPPSGAQIAVSALSIEGITGLLSKPATITIQYSSDDLSVANGDASKLVLARWDKTDNQWVLIPTKVDEITGTLSVTTDRLSTWAVMVAEVGAPIGTTAPVGTKTEGFTALLACGALGLLFIVNRYRRR